MGRPRTEPLVVRIGSPWGNTQDRAPGAPREALRCQGGRASTLFAGGTSRRLVLRWPLMNECLVCGSPKVVARRRCRTCYRFYRRTGRDRSADELHRARNHALVRVQKRTASVTGDLVAFLAALGFVVLVFLFIVVFKSPSLPAPAPAPLMRPVVTPSGPVPIPGPTRGP